MMKTTPRSPIPYFFHQGRRGVLLVHGFTGSTAEMMPLAQYFVQHGWSVSAPLLAGHGTEPEELANTTWQDWLHSAEAGLRRLQVAGCTELYAVGHSMGGLLVLQLAMQYSLQGIATLSTPIRVQDRYFPLVGILKRFLPIHRRRSEKAPHIEAKIFPYSYVPMESIDQLRLLLRRTRFKLKRVTTPIFVAQSGQDETVRPESGPLLYQRVGSPIKELKIYPASTHLITLDHEREQLFQDVLHFFISCSAGAAPKIQDRS